MTFDEVAVIGIHEPPEVGKIGRRWVQPGPRIAEADDNSAMTSAKASDVSSSRAGSILCGVSIGDIWPILILFKILITHMNY